MEIKALAYLGIGSTAPRDWLQFGTEILGMMPARAIPGVGWGFPGAERPLSEQTGIAADGSVYLKMDERQWRIGVHPHAQDGTLLYLGLELDGPHEFAAAIQELKDAKIDVTVGSEADAQARAVTAIARLRDPAGIPIELFYGQTWDYKFHSPYFDHHFLAGSLGLGHVNLFVSKQTECFDFYTQVLGFKLTDYIRFGPQFLRCNPRHHSVALMDAGGVTGLQHFLVEVTDIDAVGRTLDRAKKAGINIVTTMGRHRNDGTLSFYMRGPGGFDVEVGCEAKLIDDSWRANEFCEGDVWGHDGIMEAIMDVAKGMGERQ
ncbi:MAG: VOC family protein [Proteobacteria bacterium]|nr:VOC family protein [Pseudomonadota bacterium]